MINAENKKVGRLCSQIVKILLGKDKIYYSPHNDCGDYVVLINADKSFFSANKFEKKEYITHSGYPGGQKSATPKEVLAKTPTRVVEVAVRKMLPKNKLGDAMFKKLFAYAGTEHFHAAQKPEVFTVKS